MPINPDPPKSTVELLTQMIGGFIRNVFGSDATVAYTAEYAWLSNQMSHATMGFFLGIIWVLKVQEWGWQPAAMFLIFLVPLLKDTIDYLMDTWRGSGPFRVNKRELLLDGVTDNVYWGIGMMLAIVTIGITENVWEWRVATVIVSGILALFLAIKVWLPVKKKFDFSRMPFNFVRLIKYPEPEKFLSTDSQRELRAFQDYAEKHAKTERNAKHFLLVGGRPIVRSGLAVSMGCEYISHSKGVYMISAVKILEDPERMRNHCQMAKDYKADVFCLIIDDLNVQLPIPVETEKQKASDQRKAKQSSSDDSTETRQSAKLLHFVEVFGFLRETFPHVTTVWVASANRREPFDEKRLQEWQSYIQRLVGSSLTTIEVHEEKPAVAATGGSAS